VQKPLKNGKRSQVDLNVEHPTDNGGLKTMKILIKGKNSLRGKGAEENTRVENLKEKNPN